MLILWLHWCLTRLLVDNFELLLLLLCLLFPWLRDILLQIISILHFIVRMIENIIFLTFLTIADETASKLGRIDVSFERVVDHRRFKNRCGFLMMLGRVRFLTNPASATCCSRHPLFWIESIDLSPSSWFYADSFLRYLAARFFSLLDLLLLRWLGSCSSFHSGSRNTLPTCLIQRIWHRFQVVKCRLEGLFF